MRQDQGAGDDDESTADMASLLSCTSATAFFLPGNQWHAGVSKRALGNIIALGKSCMEGWVKKVG